MSQENIVVIEHSHVAYRVHGQGPALLVVNGLGLVDPHLGSLVEQLSAHRTVITMDYSGSGATTDNGEPLSLELLASQVAAVVGAVGLGKVDLLGFSMGALIAAHVTVKFPNLVRSLVILNGLPWGGDPGLKLQFSLWLDLIHVDRAAFGKIIMLNGFSPRFLTAVGDEFIENQMAAMGLMLRWEGAERQTVFLMTADVRETAKEISVPTLVLGSTFDRMVPSVHVQKFASLIPGAIYEELPTGHMALLENSDSVLNPVRKFLDSRG